MIHGSSISQATLKIRSALSLLDALSRAINFLPHHHLAFKLNGHIIVPTK